MLIFASFDIQFFSLKVIKCLPSTSLQKALLLGRVKGMLMMCSCICFHLGSSSNKGSFEKTLTFVNSVTTPIQPINKGPVGEEGQIEE